MIVFITMKVTILSTLLFASSAAEFKHFKMLIPAGKTECVYFHQNEHLGYDLETKVYGKSPGSIPGPAEIGLLIKSGGNKERVIFLEEHQPYKFSIIGNGSAQHELCYDNARATLVAKKVYLSMFSQETFPAAASILPPANGLKQFLDNIGAFLEQAERLLDQTRMSHFADFQRASNCNFWVGAWSLAHVLLMLSTGFLQVFVVKKLLSGYT